MSWWKQLFGRRDVQITSTGSVRVSTPNLSPNDDPLYEQAAAFVISTGSCSVSNVQRHFKIGYSRASELIESLEDDLVISSIDGSGKRSILSPTEREEERERRNMMILSRQAEIQDRLNCLISKYGDPDIARMILDAEIWQGMSKEQLIDSLGRPEGIDSSMNSSGSVETYKYGHMGHNRYSTRVTVKNGFITGWDIKD